jgi:N-acetylglutamate synthase
MMIRTLEELSMNAWPAVHTVLADGWVLRFANGYTRRANSVHPLYATSQPLDVKIESCRRLYQGRGLPLIVKITSASLPKGLDRELADRGFTADAHTGVQTLDLGNWQPQQEEKVQFSSTPTEEWQAAYSQMSSLKDSQRSSLKQILELIAPRHCFASLQSFGETVACGMGVLQDGWIGLYDIVTASTYRRQGFGEEVVRGLISWGARQGVRKAYLQVMLNNAPALRLYEKIGFNLLYEYWYRVKPASE